MINDNPEMTQEQMDMGIGVAEKMMSPGIFVAFSIVGSLFIGFIISLITGLILKNNRPE